LRSERSPRRAWLAVEAHRSADRAGVGRHRGIPEAVADDGDMRRGGLLLALVERAAERWGYTHRPEEAAGDAGHVQWARFASVVPTREHVIRQRDVGEGMLRAANRLEVGIGLREALVPTVDRARGPDDEETVRIGDADAREEERLECREHDGIGAERERHRENGDGECGLASGEEPKAGLAHQPAKSVDHAGRPVRCGGRRLAALDGYPVNA